MFDYFLINFIKTHFNVYYFFNVFSRKMFFNFLNFFFIKTRFSWFFFSFLLTTLLYPTQPSLQYCLPNPYPTSPSLPFLAYHTLPSLPYLAQSTLHCQAAIPYPNLPFHTLSYLPSLAKPTQTVPQLSLPKPAYPSLANLAYPTQASSSQKQCFIHM